MFKSKLSKVIVSLLRRIAGVTRSGAKRLMRAMLRSLMAMGRRARLPMAGFVLPTVTMVLLVVILLTVAITMRSFDRANTARNVRVNQQVLAAATPALDRAKAKIEYMLREDPQRPTATPSDAELYRMMSAYDATNDFYKFADEQRLILKFPVNNGTTLVNAGDPKGPLVNQANQENEAINTAWRYPVDTNNDGKFDTFTLYGIYFRTPQTQRSRTAIEARTPPMEPGTLNPACTQGAGTIASLVGNSGWERASNGRFQKSFFVYTVNVPITANDIQTSGLDATKYEAFKGTSSVSALEYQQDQSRIPLSNNAVVYEDDLDISPGVSLNLNGRILTNSNLLVSPLNNAQLRLFQVSSKQSCFYEADNSTIVVGGNVVNGWAANSTTQNPVLVDLFKSITGDPNQPGSDNATINNATNQSVNQNSLRVLYNNNAYSNRLNALVQAQIQADATGANDPISVQQAILSGQTRDQALQDYFKARLRKVPFAEVPPGTPNGGVNPADAPFIIQDAGKVDSLRPIPIWSLPTTETAPNVSALTGPTNLTIRPAQLPSRDPDDIQPGASELNLGERVVVGNNLPEQRWNGTKFTSDSQQVDGTTPWIGGVPGGEPRTRTPQVIKLANVGDTDRGNGTGEAPPATNPPYRDGFWEKTAAEIPRTRLDAVGGLRVITSAGVYDRTNSFLPPPSWIDAGAGTLKSGPASIVPVTTPANHTYDDPATAAVEQYPVVWPDLMPMSPLGLGSDVYDNLTGNWRKWVNAPPGVMPPVPPVVVTQANLSDLPATQTNPNFPFVAENPSTARQFAKGDLRMRATAVYHYATNTPVPAAGAQPQQTPVACISSYYDPSNVSTARNILPLPDVSGEGDIAPTRGAQQAFIGSNNGITYGPPTVRLAPATSTLNANGLLENGDAILEAQANLVFPDGRFANGPLRTALQVPDAQRTLAQKAAIDSTNCALQILDGSIARGGELMPIPDGAIQEVAFLNGREIKASDADNTATIVNEAFTLSSPASNDPVPTRAQEAATLTGNYNQPLEEREPLEIRATQLNIGLLRGPTPIAGPNATAPEWLLPNSGIIYASRDDALPDRSARTLNNALVPPQIDETTSKRISPTDYQLDPTRKPNGIVLINGQQLFRGGAAPTASNDLNAIVREKGLTFVSNLPVYIKNNFNLHGNLPPAPPGTTATFTPVEEFTETLNTVWGNFYTRNSQLNTNFACRAGDPRLPQCTNGDFWRPATVLADSLTLLSENYRFGFRNEGDFDLRNNAGAAAVWPRRQQGFFNNNYVTNGLSSGAFLPSGNLATPGDTTALTDATYRAPFANGLLTSSYFNNFVTPVQRRGDFPQYLMETCTKLPVAACTDNDWFVNPLTTPPLRAADAITSTPNYVTPVDNTSVYQAGSTVDPPLPELQRFPRRVAFQRNPIGTPPANELPDPDSPQPLGIAAAGGAIGAGIGDPRANSLWFAGSNGPAVNFDNASLPYVVNPTTIPANTTDGANVLLPTLVAATSAPPNSAIGSVANPPPTALPAAYNGSQPLLLPVPQIQTQSVATPTGGNTMPRGTTNARFTGWIPQAVNTTFNLIAGAGDTPSRTLDLGFTIGDFNGGLQNLPRFLESWNAGGSTTNIRGSFIQLNRSAFSTAPYQPILPGAVISSVFQLQGVGPFPPPLAITNTYNTDTGAGLLPYFSPPTRNWGYDVGLLSQPPDLFTQKFTTPSKKTEPAEYFREVPRNDTWVTTLMCGVVAPDQPNGGKNATAMRSNCPT